MNLHEVLIRIPGDPKASRPLIDGISDGAYLRLGNAHAVARGAWSEMPAYQQHHLRTLAIGRELRGGVLAGRSAARVHGLWVIAAKEERVHVVLPSGGRRPRGAWGPHTLYLKRRIFPEDIVELHGVRVTAAPRTCVDIACWEGFAAGLAAMDCFLSNGGHPSALQKAIARAARHKGVAHARRAFAAARNDTESPYESYFRALLLDNSIAGLVSWREQVSLYGYRVDFLMPGGLVVEIDGDSKYGERPESVIVAERKREKELTNRGHRVLRFTPRQLLTNPQQCLALLEQALSEVNAKQK